MFPCVTKPPSETFHQQISLTLIGGDRQSLEQRYDVGVENLMWGSDFPHHDSPH